MKLLEGRTALVTGAARGIGAAVAKELAANGARVIINYSGSEAAAMQVAEDIEKNGGSASIFKCDVSDYKAVEAMIADITQKEDRIDILVNNAGITRDGLIMRMAEEDFDRVNEVNLKGTFNCIRHAARQMLKQRSGRIINMSSVVGLRGNAGQVNYSASKAGVIGITKSAAKELASRNITVNAIAPGYICTDMTEALSEKVKESVQKEIPLSRMGTVEDIAKTVLFLASDSAAYITGQVISVDGGMNI